MIMTLLLLYCTLMGCGFVYLSIAKDADEAESQFFEMSHQPLQAVQSK